MAATSRTRNGVGAHVCLVEQDDRLGAAVAREQQVPLDAAQVELAVEPAHEEDDVDIRGDHLLPAVPPGLAPRETGPTGQHRADPGGTVLRVGLDRHPVADGGQLGRGARARPEPTGDDRLDREALAPHLAAIREAAAHAGRHETVRTMGLEAGLEPFVPAEVLDRHGRGLHFWLSVFQMVIGHRARRGAEVATMAAP